VSAALVALWLAVGTTIAVSFSGRIRDWSVMTDELLYAKLATSIGNTFSPLPTVHDTTVEVYNQLYPLLLAPFYGTLSAPDAFRAAHVLNAFVMASAAFPAYLLARQVVGRAWSFAVAALTILVPWMILTGFVMTENAAYPAFLWAIVGLQRATAEPSPRRDLLAAGALALAALARTQFLVLVLVLPLAILAHEIGYPRRVVAGARAAFERHRVLAGVYAIGVLGVAVLAVADSAGGVLGVYAVTLEEGSLLPSEVWAAAARHVDAVAIGCGFVPLVLGGGWMLVTLVRPATRAEHAFATLALLAIIALTFEVASFGVRFGADVVRDRYLFYVVPLLLVGTAAALTRTTRRHEIAIGAAFVTVFFAATAASLPFTTYPGVWVDSPASVLNELLIEQSGDLGTGTFVALLGLFAGVVLVLALLFARRALLAGSVVAALVLFSVLTLESEADRILAGTGLSGRPLADQPGIVLDWVDTVVPHGEEAAILAFPVSTAWDTTAIRWWDAELWSRSIGQAYVADDGNFRYTPFPHRRLRVDWNTGEVAETADAPRYVLMAPGESRFLLAGRTNAENLGLEMREVERPYHALWASRGLQADGWTTPERRATIRVYAASGRRARVEVMLRAPHSGPAGYRVTAPGVRRVGRLEAAAAAIEAVDVCGTTEITLDSSGRARIEGVQLGPEVEETRVVGVGVGPVAFVPLPGEC
jgi:hypothetical protein